MKPSAPTHLALALLIPAAASAWSCGPGGCYSGVVIRPGSGLLVDGTQQMVSPERFFRRRRQQQEMMQRAFFTRTSSPRYEIVDADDQVQISLDVPGVQAEDISVSVEKTDGAVLSVTAGRRDQTLGKSPAFSSKVSQSFRLDAAVDIDKFTANLKNGVLVITAPKDLKRLETNIRKIQVTEEDLDEALGATPTTADAVTVAEAPAAETEAPPVSDAATAEPAPPTATDAPEDDAPESATTA